MLVDILKHFLFLILGIRIEHIQCFRVDIAPLEFTRSGCCGIKIQNSLTRTELRGLTLIEADDDNCLIYALGMDFYKLLIESFLHNIFYIACSVFHNDELQSCKPKCEHSKENCLECNQIRDQTYKKTKSLKTTWDKYLPRINHQGINAPSSLLDVFHLEVILSFIVENVR